MLSSVVCPPTGVCKDTVASISEPVQQNLYGLRDGAWMKDARGHGNVIYLTNGHYGNSLLEFRDMDTLSSGIRLLHLKRLNTNGVIHKIFVIDSFYCLFIT